MCPFGDVKMAFYAYGYKNNAYQLYILKSTPLWR